MLILCWSLIGAFFLFLTIATSIMSHSILPALIILISVAFIASFEIVTTIDMNKAYVQIDGDNITVVDYYFFSKKEVTFVYQKLLFLFIQAAGLAYHRRTKCGAYHQPLWGCISSRASVHLACGLMIYNT